MGSISKMNGSLDCVCSQETVHLPEVAAVIGLGTGTGVVRPRT